jgi:hypothetical protein
MFPIRVGSATLGRTTTVTQFEDMSAGTTLSITTNDLRRNRLKYRSKKFRVSHT